MVALNVKETNDGAKKKNPMSIILQDGRNWISVETAMPNPNVCVVVRFVDETRGCYAEDDENIIYAEDKKIAKWVPDFNDPTKGTWRIEPPFPKYDFSPLSKLDQLIGNAHVTHWSIVNENELEWWRTRFEPINQYKMLDIKVSPEDEEDLYRALITGASFIARSVGGELEKPENAKSARLYSILNDLQFCIDGNCRIINGKSVKNPTLEQSFIEIANGIYKELNMKYDLEKISGILAALQNIHDSVLVPVFEPVDGTDSMKDYMEDDDTEDEDGDE